MPRILIIEDETPMRTALKDVVENEGYRAITAADGASGLKRAVEEKPDLILLDVMMPVMDGFEFLATMRQDDAMANIPVVVVTAKDLTEAEHRILNGSAAAVIQKNSMDQQALLQKICSAITRTQPAS